VTGTRPRVPPKLLLLVFKGFGYFFRHNSDGKMRKNINPGLTIAIMKETTLLKLSLVSSLAGIAMLFLVLEMLG